jgi:hypothetical protein
MTDVANEFTLSTRFCRWRPAANEKSKGGTSFERSTFTSPEA